jgi:hydrogenase nickel incorporation protein HypA/HybF
VHELSIVTYVLDRVEEIAKENDITKISSVTLEFGEVSGIVPEYLSDCWNWYAKKTPLIEGSELRSEIIPAVTWCDDCKKTYPTVKYGNSAPIAAGPTPGCSRAMK